MATKRAPYTFLFLYLLLIAYGSLFPLADWRIPEQRFLEIWRQALVSHVSRSDVLTNFLAYMPIGFFLSASWSPRITPYKRIVLVFVVGLFISCSLEYLQLFLPARTSSPIDVGLNSFSSLLGAVLFNWCGAQSKFGSMFGTWRLNNVHSGIAADIGLFVIFMWGATQLAPFVPSLDFGSMKNGIKPLWQTLHDLSRFNWYRTISYGLNISCLGAVQQLIGTYRGRALHWLGLYCGSIFFLKPLIVGRQISLEALVGLVAGISLTVLLQKLPKASVMFAGGLSVVGAFIVEELRPDVMTVELHPFNWIPFASQMAENMSGISAILEGIWPFIAVGFYAIVHSSVGRKINVFSGAVVVAGCVLTLECAQTRIPGRYPDITLVLLAIVGWSLPMMLAHKNKDTSDESQLK